MNSDYQVFCIFLILDRVIYQRGSDNNKFFNKAKLKMADRSFQERLSVVGFLSRQDTLWFSQYYDRSLMELRLFFCNPCDQPSAHRFLHEGGDPCLFGGGYFLQRKGDRPQDTIVEVRCIAKAERPIPRLELLRALEEADNLAIPGIGGHPIPGFRREGWRAGFDDRVESPGHGAIRFRQRVDRCKHCAFPFRLVLIRALLPSSPWRALSWLRVPRLRIHWRAD